VSLDGSTITVQGNGEAEVKLSCTGTGMCAGKLTLTELRLAVKILLEKGKRTTPKTKTKTETLGTATFFIPAGKTATIELKLNAVGRALLGAAHGRLSASLTVLKSAPGPTQTLTEDVQLVQRRAHGKAGRR